MKNKTRSSFAIGGRVVRMCWVNLQCRGVLLVWIIVGQGPTALAVGAGGGCLDIFSLIYHFSFLSPSLWETARYRLKYCLKGPLSPKQPNQSLFHLCEVGQIRHKTRCVTQVVTRVAPLVYPTKHIPTDR